MLLKRIVSPGLAHHSYLLGAGGEAVVVDPRRDVQVYLDLAKEHDLRLTHVLETHRNEDYAIGSTALAAAVDCEILHSGRLDFAYGRSVSEGDEIGVGALRLRAIETPGHTPESLSWALRESQGADGALAVFTGDALFFGDTGRTDLLGEERARELAEQLHASLHEKILPLGDQVSLLPGHGPGSVCGAGIADRALSTLGYERRANELLQRGREAFVDAKLGERHVVPPHFERMEEWNLRGNAPVHERLPLPPPVSPGELAELREDGVLVLDARLPQGFAAGHVPASVNCWLDGLSSHGSWVAPPGTRVALVLPQHADVAEAVRRLYRIGVDDFAGVLRGGFESWQDEGRPIATLGAADTLDVRRLLSEEGGRILDVRTPAEHAKGTIEGALPIFLGELEERLSELPTDRPLIATCGVGHRGSLAASLLERRGFENLHVYLGGMKAWSAQSA